MKTTFKQAVGKQNEALSNLAKNSLYFKSSGVRSGRSTNRSKSTQRDLSKPATEPLQYGGEDFQTRSDKIVGLQFR